VRIGINIAPMIDMTFLLLIFFVVTTTFERAEGLLRSRFPRDAGAPSVGLPLRPIIVRLTAPVGEGEKTSIALDGFSEVPDGFDALYEQLRAVQQLDGFDEKTPVVIVPQGRVPWDDVVNAWNAAVRCRYQNIAFGGS
jgi:biopolymer transport protein ExbD